MKTTGNKSRRPRRRLQPVVSNCGRCHDTGITQEITHGGWVTEWGFCECEAGVHEAERIIGIVLRRQLTRTMKKIMDNFIANSELDRRLSK